MLLDSSSDLYGCGAVLHVDVVVGLVPDGLDAEVLGRGVGVNELMTTCAGVDEERSDHLTFTGPYQHPRVYALTV